VRVELVSKNDYADFWKIRTHLMQGSKVMLLEGNCKEDYVLSMTDIIDGQMSLTMSTWDGRNQSNLMNWQSQCSAASTCDASVTYSNFKTFSEGYNE